MRIPGITPSHYQILLHPLARVRKESLANMAKISILVNFVMLTLLAAGQTLAQQSGPSRAPSGNGHNPWPPLSSEPVPGETASPLLAEQSHWPQTAAVSEPPEQGPIGPGCVAHGADGVCCPPAWYFEENVRVLYRSPPHSTTLTLSRQSGAEDITAHQLGFNVAAGFEGTAGHYLGRDDQNRNHFLEFTFWGLNSWLTDLSPEAPLINHVTAIDGPIGGFHTVDQLLFTYRSEINNYELNLRVRPRARADRLVLQPNGVWQRECNPGLYPSFLLGLRAIETNERFNTHETGTGLVGQVPAAVDGQYDIATRNVLLGFQIGGDLIDEHCHWNWGGRWKIAPCVNFSRQDSRINVAEAGVAPIADRFFADNDEAGVVLEGGMFFNYRLASNLVAHAAYDFTWIYGLALAPEQYSFNPGNRINTHGQSLYQGLSLGLAWLW